MQVWLVFAASWAICATLALAVLLARQSEALRLPVMGNPVTPEERKALEDLADAESTIADLRTRLKHAAQERDRAVRDEAQMRAELWSREKRLRDIRRLLDRAPEQAPTADAETVELVGIDRAG